MKLNQLTRLAKDAIDRRGGVDSIKQDLKEAQQAASGHDNLIDKARAAAGAFKEPGDDRRAGGEAPASGSGSRPSGTPEPPRG
jgi:hypothetical protein